MSLLSDISRFIRNNSPFTKPELWSELPGSLVRNFEMRLAKNHKVHEVRIAGNTKVRADTATSIGHALYIYKSWEYPITRLFKTLLQPTTVFLDIGANIGYFSVLAATKCNYVFAFEPVRAVFTELQANVALNGFENVEMHCVAVSDRNGDLPFYVVESRNNGLSSLAGFSGGSEIIVPSVRLDSFLRGRPSPKVDLIKIDVEGAEERVIEGALELLSPHVAPDIIFERHPSSSSDRLLKELGYQIFGLRHQRSYEATNLFATKRGPSPATARLLEPWAK